MAKITDLFSYFERPKVHPGLLADVRGQRLLSFLEALGTVSLALQPPEASCTPWLLAPPPSAEPGAQHLCPSAPSGLCQ